MFEAEAYDNQDNDSYLIFRNSFGWLKYFGYILK